MSTFRVNGVNVATYGVQPRNIDSWWSTVLEEIASLSPPGVHRSIRSGTFVAPAISWQPQFYLPLSAGESGREQVLDSFRRALRGIPEDGDSVRNFSEGEVALQAGSSDRKRYAVYRGDQVGHTSDPLRFSGDVITLSLEFYDAARYDDAEETEIPDSDPVFVECGTLPMWWQADITDAVDPEWIVYQNEGSTPGDEIFRLTLTAEPGSGEVLQLDALGHRILLDGDDVTETVLPLDAGFFHQLDSGGEDGVWVELTSGSATLHTRKRWR